MKKLYFIIAGCLFALTINAQCPITISGNTTICQGDQTTLTANSTATSYTWMPGAINSATAAVNPNATTTYTVIGTDGVCTDSTTVTVTVVANPTITVNPNPAVICQGQVTNLMASGATTYTWSPGTGLSATTGAVVSASPFTTMQYTLTGSSGTCTSVTTVTVNVLPTPSFSVMTTPSSCGICNGSASVMVFNGVAPFTYSWLPMGNTTSTINGACPGTYSCIITDANGCVGSNFATIGTATNVANIYTSVIPAACGQSDGSITIDSIPGATPPFNIMYTYQGATYNSPTNVISNLQAGVYGVSVSDSAGCQGTLTLTVNNSNFTVQFTPTAPGCNLCDGSLSANTIGGTPPFSYSWSNGANTSTAANLCVGNYRVDVSDSNGCFTSATTTLISPAAPVIMVDSIINITCNGITVGSATVSASGGVAPYTYSWNTTPTQTTNIASNLQSGNYMVTVTDNAGCSSTKWIYIANSNNIYVYATSLNPANCSSNGSATVTALGGVPPYNFNWNNGATGSSANNLASGIYNVTAIDANGCSGVGQVNIYSQCFNTIKGRVYNDTNQNCIQDAGETGLQGYAVSAGGYYAYTDYFGDYSLLTPYMNNTVGVYLTQPYASLTCPPTGTLTVNFSTLGDTSNNNNFGFYSNPNYVDVGIHPGWSNSSPGSTKTYWFFYWNHSLTPQNVLVRFVYDSLLQYTGCTYGGVHFAAQHKIEWTFNNVAPISNWNWSSQVQAFFNVPVTITLNDTLDTHFEILPLPDANPFDNTLDNREPVTGSHDPNEKTVFPQGTGSNGNILRSDSVLFYTIHFQNNGNDTAFRVVVVDTLSPFLDPATIIPGAANHPYKFDLSGQGICTWTFDSIMLPDSLTNEPASNGYFNYTIKQKPNNPYGSVIKNTADIYFDYNSAVITNTTINTITAPVAVPEIKSISNSFVLYPNPTSGNVILRYQVLNAGPVQIEFRNILGELVKTETYSNKHQGINTDELSTSELTNGVYLVRIVNGNKQQSQKLVIQR